MTGRADLRQQCRGTGCVGHAAQTEVETIAFGLEASRVLKAVGQNIVQHQHSPIFGFAEGQQVTLCTIQGCVPGHVLLSL